MAKVVVKDGVVTVDGQDTVAKLFRDRVGRWGDRIAMREKTFGIWESLTWRDFDHSARRLAGGLVALGLKRGDVVAILSETNKEWVFADMAVHLAGGIVNGIYPTYKADQVKHLLADSGARFLFVENEEQLDKYLEGRDRLPLVEKVFVFDWKGLRGFEDPEVVPLDHLSDLGAGWLANNPAVLDAIVDEGRCADTAVLVYTSGTTGQPKGARIPNAYLMFTVGIAPDHYPVGPDDELLTYLPLCHAAERMLSLCMSLGHGPRLNFAENSETVFQNIQELSPTLLFAVPRIWEKFYSRVSTLVSEATWIGQLGYRTALTIGRRRAEHLIAGRTPPVGLRVGFALADLLVFRNIKMLLGLDRARFMLSGAAPISADLLKWYLALGLPIAEVYGQTETGVATFSDRGRFKPGTVGRPVPGVEVRTDAHGEILVRSPGVFSGYHNMAEATAATLVDGWVRTGDVGVIEGDGMLRITDRIKDIIITAGGKNVTPSLIENQLKFSPYISDAIVIGDRRKYLTCLIMIDQENVEHYAQSNAIPFTDYRSLCARPEVKTLIEGEILRVNQQFSSVEQIKKFRLIDILLTPEDEELTPTMKLKRGFVEKKYAGMIEQMY
ncbi:AMP-binding protein [Azospirillum sp. RWY-5-1]|uniref:AMP-binding protein n=1 Tax=Azospirillum oleiclasticum TaxID=2735135 RepID=A0ABX2TFH5_9PROT|nr:AMP-binding protein [Azospirillum oleiclasticum]NYZ15801.1 AMP-binding protein [Azospirillum oleiclasticum]NYZ22071.1 AMP-binding protein [Azospirillum oleiclasticum]